MHILNSPITCPDGKYPYRAVVEPSNYFEGEMTLKVQQKLNGEWRMTPGQWGVNTLLERPSNSIAIDFGLGWTVNGVYRAALEAQELFEQGAFDEALKTQVIR